MTNLCEKCGITNESTHYWHPAITSITAENGHLDCLKYAHINGAKWTKYTTSSAARNGHLDCLKYAHENDCKWNKNTAFITARNDHLDCLIYCIENGFHFTEKDRLSLTIKYTNISERVRNYLKLKLD